MDIESRIEELIEERLREMKEQGFTFDFYFRKTGSERVAWALVDEDIARATYTATLWAEREARGWVRGGGKPAPRFESKRVEVAKLKKQLAKFSRLEIELVEGTRPSAFPHGTPGQLDKVIKEIEKLNIKLEGIKGAE